MPFLPYCSIISIIFPRYLFFSSYKALGSKIYRTDLAGKNLTVLLEFPDVFDVTGMTVDYTDDRYSVYACDDIALNTYIALDSDSRKKFEISMRRFFPHTKLYFQVILDRFHWLRGHDCQFQVRWY